MSGDLYVALGGANTTSDLYIVDSTTGNVVQDIGPIGFAVTGLAINPVTGILYGVTSERSRSAPRSLITIDTGTGLGSLVGPLGLRSGDPITDITFLGPVLYGWSKSGELYTISLTTGTATLVGNSGLGEGNGGGLAENPSGTAMYVTPEPADGGRIFLVNPADGSVTPAGTLDSADAVPIFALAFNASGVLYGSMERQRGRNSVGVLITINLTTNPGQITEIGLINQAGDPLVSPDAIVFFPAICVHGSSLITMADGERMSISNVKKGATILGADGKVTPVTDVLPCWLKVPMNPAYHSCIVFEPNSLGIGVPDRRFAIDPGHPMCTPAEFRKGGLSALKEAKHYFQRGERRRRSSKKRIQVTDWEKVQDLLPGAQRRYDLLMPHDSCGAYLANGVVVKARVSVKEPGYDHRGGIGC